MLKVPLGLPRKHPVRDHPLAVARLRSSGAHTGSDAGVVALAGALTTGAGGVMMPDWTTSAGIRLQLARARLIPRRMALSARR